MSSAEPKPGGESTLTVVLAPLVNLAIAIMKLIAELITGSAAMLAEAAHSVADTFTEALLLTALRRSDSVLVCARLDFDDSLGAADLERACVRIDSELRDEFQELSEIFLEPVPRNDPELRARVLARYGFELHRGAGH